MAISLRFCSPFIPKKPELGPKDFSYEIAFLERHGNGDDINCASATMLLLGVLRIREMQEYRQQACAF